MSKVQAVVDEVAQMVADVGILEAAKQTGVDRTMIKRLIEGKVTAVEKLKNLEVKATQHAKVARYAKRAFR